MNQMIRTKPLAQVISFPNKFFSSLASNQRRRGGCMIYGVENLLRKATSDTANVKITRKTYNAVFQGYPDVLDVKQVGELLGISTKTVYRLLNEGTLASLKVGRAFKVPKFYLLQYIKVAGHTQPES